MLNEKLDEFQDKPRNMSEPKMRYVPPPDLSAEAIEALSPRTYQHIKTQIEEGTLNTEESYTFDIASYQQEKAILDNFLIYRHKFEQSQKLRIQAAQEHLVSQSNEDAALGELMGIPFLSFETMDPRAMQQKIEEDRANKRGSKINENVKLKICDLGNGCWTYHHFSTKIQTR